MSREQLNNLIAGYLTDDINAVEGAELARLLQLPEYQMLFQELIHSQLQGEMLNLDTASVQSLERIQRALAAKIDVVQVNDAAPIEDLKFAANDFPPAQPHRIHFLKTSWFRYAAAIILVFGTAAYFWNTNSKTEQTQISANKHLQTDVPPGTNRAVLTIDNKQMDLALDQTGIAVGSNTISYINGKKLSNAGNMLTLTTPKGGQYQLILPDGSKIWLNAASSIKFPSVFAGKKRSVVVTGEVYMEVAQNSRKPFMVSAGGSEIQVLGTSFNVNAYEDEGMLKTTLIDGSVKVNQVILKPGQQAIQTLNAVPVATSTDGQPLKNSGTVIVNSNVNISQILAWKNGIFDFDALDVKSVMRQLERWYDIKVQYRSEVRNIEFKGAVYRNLTLSEVLKMINELGVKTRLEGRTVIVL